MTFKTLLFDQNDRKNIDDHPLLQLKIIDRFRKNVPFVEQMIILIDNNYMKLTNNGENVLGKFGENIRTLIYAMINFVPQRPVTYADSMASDSFDFIHKQMQNFHRLTIVVYDKTMLMPKYMLESLLSIKSLLNYSMSEFYKKLDKFLSSIEVRLKYWFPVPEDVHNHDNDKDTMKLNLNDIKISEIFQRLSVFVKRSNTHLKSYLNGQIFFEQLFTIVNNLKINIVQIFKKPLKPIEATDTSVKPIETSQTSMNEITKPALDAIKPIVNDLNDANNSSAKNDTPNDMNATTSTTTPTPGPVSSTEASILPSSASSTISSSISKLAENLDEKFKIEIKELKDQVNNIVDQLMNKTNDIEETLANNTDANHIDDNQTNHSDLNGDDGQNTDEKNENSINDKVNNHKHHNDDDHDQSKQKQHEEQQEKKSNDNQISNDQPLKNSDDDKLMNGQHDKHDVNNGEQQQKLVDNLPKTKSSPILPTIRKITKISKKLPNNHSSNGF